MKRNNYGKLNESYWIGGSRGAYPMAAETYTYSCGYRLLEGNKAGIVVAARNKDNYLLIEIDHKTGRMTLYDVCDNAWGSGEPSKTACGRPDGYPVYGLRELNRTEISVCRGSISIKLNDSAVIESEEILPQSEPFTPRKNMLMLTGADAREGCIMIYAPAAVIDGVTFKFRGAEQFEIRNCFELFSCVPCVSVRKHIEARREIRSAVLYSSARGFYNVCLNGKKIGNEYFAPGFTDYRLRIQYQKYDIKDMLVSGENIIRAVVGQGYYSGFAGYNHDAGVYGGQNAFIARMEIEYTDGTSEVIVTDESWELAECEPVIFADYLQGEYYDARLEDAGAEWNKCSIVPDSTTPVPTNGEAEKLEFTMEEQDYTGAHEVMHLAGKACGEICRGHIIYDMGQNMVGTVKIKLRGKSGGSIKVRYGEMLGKNGGLYTANLRSAANTDVYVLKGAPEGEVFCPDLTAHGFRYAEITGHGCSLRDTDIVIEDVTGIILSNIDRITGGFECSEELVNKLYSNIVWSQRGNYLLIPTDCPQRNERMGWTGDAQVFARTAAYNMDVYDFTRKWLRDLREAQLMFNRGGSVPDIAPLCGDNRGGCGGWADATVIVPWEMYMAYGDKTVLEENYEMMKAWVEYRNSPERRNYGLRTVNGVEQTVKSDFAEIPYIQTQQPRGDHLAFDESTPFILSATAYAAYTAELTAKTADVLGKKSESEKYRILHDKIKRAFNEAWVQPDGTLAYWGEMSKPGINETRYSDAEGSADHPSQTAYALAIDFGLIDTEKYPRAARCFRRTIDERGGRLSTGFLGISHLLPALMKCGFKDTAFALLEQKENPGWLYSVINGATTVWERWDSYIAESGAFGSPSMNSFNHYAYGAIGEWMFGEILGIKPSEPGYGSFTLKPYYGGSLSYAKGFHITPHGKIEAAWRLENDSFIYSCTVPENTSARLIMPDGSTHRLEPGEYEFTACVGE